MEDVSNKELQRNIKELRKDFHDDLEHVKEDIAKSTLAQNKANDEKYLKKAEAAKLYVTWKIFVWVFGIAYVLMAGLLGVIWTEVRVIPDVRERLAGIEGALNPAENIFYYE